MGDAAHANERSGNLATETSEATQEVAGTARDEALTVARDARQQAGEVATEATQQMRAVMADTKQQLRDEADAQTAKLAGSMHRLSDQVRALTEGRADEAGPLPHYLGEATARLDRMASGLDARGLEGAVQDVQRFARRRPAAFLLAAVGLGFVAGRAFRSMKDDTGGADGAPNGPSQLPGSTTGTASVGLPAGSVPASTTGALG